VGKTSLVPWVNVFVAKFYQMFFFTQNLCFVVRKHYGEATTDRIKQIKIHPPPPNTMLHVLRMNIFSRSDNHDNAKGKTKTLKITSLS
jgi:hypothetical protein